jgi:hypothetical protein
VYAVGFFVILKIPTGTFLANTSGAYAFLPATIADLLN